MGVRLNKVLTELNIGLQTAVDYLKNKKSLGEIKDDANVNTKISDEQYEALVREFKGDKDVKAQAGMIFPKKDKNEGISLSTVHKAKGLEANNVYIVCKSLMPSKSAKKDWELQQEHNLEYVAYTRAKKTLSFVNEKDFEQFDMSNATNQTILKKIETQVNNVLRKPTKVVVSRKNALDIINNAKKVEKYITTTPTVSINSTRKMNSFSDFFNNKKAIRLKR